MTKKLKQKKLDRLLAKWQRRLRLQDWNVEVRVERARDMSGPRRAGEVTFGMRNKDAVIHILDPIDYPVPLEAITPDPEATIVHELLHLHMIAFFDHDDEANRGRLVEWEQVIAILTQSFIAENRDGK